jgi:hypothetical protein
VNSTLSSNTAGHLGGGIHNFEGNLRVTSSTFNGNSSYQLFSNGALTIGSSILNSGVSDPNIGTPAGTSLGYNLSSDASGPLNQPTDVVNIDPLLGPLQNNGGPTYTHAPLPGSPAIDQGKNFSASSTDQRGFYRTVDFLDIPDAADGDGTDIGAVEVQ